MYYKIENKESKVYQELHALRTEEHAINDRNLKAIEEKTGQKWNKFLGYSGQQHFTRVTEYVGFQFTEPEKLDPKIWKKQPDYPGCYIPYTRTKKGREMKNFLNDLERSSMHSVFQILNLQTLRRYKIPYVEIFGEIILVMLDDNHNPKDENLIEITRKEFNIISKN